MGQPEDHGAEQEVAEADRAGAACPDITRDEGAALTACCHILVMAFH